MEDVKAVQEISIKINNLYSELYGVKMDMKNSKKGRGYIENALARLEQAEECLDTAIEYMSI